MAGQLPFTIAGLGARDQDVRSAAAEVLEQIAGPSALEQLSELVGSRGFSGRMEAMDIMVPKARQRAIPLIRAVLQHGGPPERIHALKHLISDDITQRAADEAKEAVRVTLRDEDRRVRNEAYKSFARIVNEEEFFDELEGDIYSDDVEPIVIESLGVFSSKRALNVLEYKIRTGNNAVRMAAIEAARTIGTDSVVSLLVSALHVDDVGVRKRAGEVLAGRAQREFVTDRAEKTLQLVDLKRGTAVSIARVGEGPAEYGIPSRLFALPGDTTLLSDLQHLRYLLISPSGQALRSFALEDEGDRRLVGLASSVDARGRFFFVHDRYGPRDASGFSGEKVWPETSRPPASRHDGHRGLTPLAFQLWIGPG